MLKQRKNKKKVQTTEKDTSEITQTKIKNDQKRVEKDLEKEEEKEQTEEEQRERNKENAHPALGSRHTRATHIFLIVLALGLLVFCIYVLIFALNRAGSGEATNSETELSTVSSTIAATATAGIAGNNLSSLSPSPNNGSGTELPSNIIIRGSQLISVGSPLEGYHYLGLNEAIVSEDGTKQLWLNPAGELLLYDLRDPSNPILCWRSCTAGQDANRFVLSSDGNGYILRANGSKVNESSSYQIYLQNLAQDPTWRPQTLNDQPIPWATPNCRGVRYRNCDPNSGFVPCTTRTIAPGCYQSYLAGPYYLRFSETGLELVSISSQNVWSSNGTNKTIYPELVSNSYAPIPLWVQPCPLPAGSNPVGCSDVPLNLNYSSGSCCPDPTGKYEKLLRKRPTLLNYSDSKSKTKTTTLI